MTAPIAPTVAIVAADGTRTELVLDRPVELGRAPHAAERDGDRVAGTEVLLTDPRASRRHAVLRPAGDTVEIEDLGSTNGTLVDGVRITAPVLLRPGQAAVIGSTRIRVLTPTPPADATADASIVDWASGDGRVSPADDISLARHPSRYATLLVDTEAYAPHYAARVGEKIDAVARALAPLCREPRVRPTVRLVASCDVDGVAIDDGFSIDHNGDIVLALGNPNADDAIVRSLAAWHAGAVPAAGELGAILDGYALVRVGAPCDDHALRAAGALRPISETTGALHTTMAHAFVRYLMAEHGEAAVVSLLTTAEPGRVDQAALGAFGAPLGALESRWVASLADDAPRTTVRDFLRQAARYFRPHKRAQAEIFVLALCSLAFTVIFAKATQRLFNNVLTPDPAGGGFAGDFADAVPILGVLGGGLVVTLLANLRQSLVSARLSADITNDVRNRMFSLLQDLSLGWHQRRDRGDVMSRFLSDVSTFEQGVSSVIREGALQVVTLAVNAVLLLQLDVKLGLLTLVGAPIAVGVYRVMGEQAQQRSLVVEQRKAGVGSVVAENLDAQPVVKAYGLESRERSRFAVASERLRKADIRLNFFAGLFNVSVGLVINLLRIGIMSLGVWLILRGDLKLGTFIAFSGVMGEVIAPMAQLADLGRTAQTSTGALARIEEILATVPDVTDHAGAVDATDVDGDLRFDRVCFAYGTGRTVLDGLDLAVPAGSRVAIVGPSGAGKSTTLALLQRNWDPTSGRVLLDGIDVKELSLGALRRAIGVVHQETFLFDGTIRENIALAKPGATDDEIRDAALAAGLRDLVESTRGLDTAVGERGSQLSVGQRQRVAIARVLLRRPAVLLLDEATSALDPITEREVVGALREASEGRTTVAVTHRLHTVQDYDHIVVLAHGAVVEQGTHDSLVALGGHYAAMWHEQQRGDGDRPNPAIDPAAHDVLSKLPPEFADFLAGCARRVELHPGDRRREGGWLGVVVAGSGGVELTGPDGRPMTAPVGPGAVFGVRSLLGEDRGAVLVATSGPLAVLEVGRHELAALDQAVLRTLAAGPPKTGPGGPGGPGGGPAAAEAAPKQG